MNKLSKKKLAELARITPQPGDVLGEVIEEMVKRANTYGIRVKCIFNEIPVIAKPGENAEKVMKHYDAIENRRYKKWVNSPEAKEAERKKKEAQIRQDAFLKGALAFAPKHMTLRDKEAWKKIIEVNKSPYGRATVEYAETWARLMEGKMAHGASLEECAKEASQIADNEGITGFMYGTAVSILAQCWIHGEELRKWHNLDTQLSNEGEEANKTKGAVLNPALMSSK